MLEITPYPIKVETVVSILKPETAFRENHSVVAGLQFLTRRENLRRFTNETRS
jgi:hypothetical protein